MHPIYSINAVQCKKKYNKIKNDDFAQIFLALHASIIYCTLTEKIRLKFKKYFVFSRKKLKKSEIYGNVFIKKQLIVVTFDCQATVNDGVRNSISFKFKISLHMSIINERTNL